MRTRWGGGVKVALALAVLAVAPAGRAAACLGCGADMYCVQVPTGATVCIGSGDACLMAGRCMGPMPGGYTDEFAMVQVTLLEDTPGAPSRGVSRVVRGAGRTGVGHAAARIARAPGGAEPGIVFSGVGAGEGATVAFRSPRGDGFTFRRDAEGRGARVTIRELVDGRPGALLARERLGDGDALVVRVTLDGRQRVLVTMTPTVPRGEAEAREREARFALRGANGARPGAEEPPFELAPVAE